MTSGAPLFSVVTVCWNAGHVLPKAMASLREQTFTDYEYVVVDGASTDGTPELLRENADLIDTVVSEPDRGIYDAMNKGVGLAKGQWLYFLNADDRLADADVLARVARTISDHPDAALVYGDVVYRTGEEERLVRFDWVSHWNIRFEHLCHQAVFARRDLFDTVGMFDTRYRINADYDWLLRVFRAGTRKAYVPVVVASYDTGGVSARDDALRRTERQEVLMKNYEGQNAVVSEFLYRGYRKFLRATHLTTR